MRVSRIALLAACAALGACAQTSEVTRYKIPNSDFPIAAAVEVPTNRAVIYLSGAGPSVIDKNAPANTIAAFGDTKTQTISALNSIRASLQRMHLDIKDIVKMQAFIVGDPAKDGKMDFDGFMEGYRQFFGTADQSNLPARSTMRVAGLVSPGWLIEIEVTAVRP